MDIKADDTLNVDIDPTFLLSYELGQLSLGNDSFPSEFFDEIKLNDESLKNDDKLDNKIDLLKDDKLTESALCKITGIKSEKTFTVKDDNLCDAEVKDEISFEYLEIKKDVEVKNEIPLEYLEIKKDINGNNDESVSEESLNELLVKLELSDSDNEEIDDHLKERGADRVSKSRREGRKKDAKTLRSKPVNQGKAQFNSECEKVKLNSEHEKVQLHSDQEKAQFNPERLRFLSGSSKIQLSESGVPNQCTYYNYGRITICNRIEPVNNFSSQELLFDDPRASSVSSPESGYDSSSVHSTSGSPPPSFFTTSGNLDEDDLAEILNADSALLDNVLTNCNVNDKDAKREITKILNYLKDDTPLPLNELPSATTNSDNLIDVVPFPSHAIISTTPVVKPSPLSITSDLKQISLTAVSKQVEPKKIVPKLTDKAKGELRQYLSEADYFDAQKKIYSKIRDDENDGKEISVIYVEDETENKTNLHNAVINGNIEDIFSIVEINKQYDLSFIGINIRDKSGKTALDYAIENQMTLVADYLKENTACQSVNLEK